MIPRDVASNRILLVEDDPASQDLIRALCEGRGASVDVAADGFLGLRLLSERRHAVVLIDYHLPEMDGYALARLMREIARGPGRVRLIGITADRHGLASRRGADTLFDAILVKPVEPEALFAVLDGPMRKPLAPRLDPADTADALWRRRGRDARPRALVLPAPGPAEAEALSQAFALADAPEAADCVLVAAEEGLARLRALRAAPAGLLPAFALGARLAPACDGHFQVGDPDSWTALAETCRAFAARVRALTAEARATADPGLRLAATLYAADRRLVLDATANGAEDRAYAAGPSQAACMAAVLALSEAGFLACEPVAEGLAFGLTEAGRARLTRAPAEDPAAAPARGGWHAPLAQERPAAPDAAPPLLRERRMAELRDLIGDEAVERLKARMLEQIAGAFAAGAAPEVLTGQAHALVSVAGSLGFERLSEACRGLERVLRDGGDGAAELARARRAACEVEAYCTAA